MKFKKVFAIIVLILFSLIHTSYSVTANTTTEKTIIEQNELFTAELEGTVLTISGTLVYDEYGFENLNITELIINEGVIEIFPFTFDNCFELKKVTLPETLEEIGNNAFSNCGIETIIIPDSVTNIGNSAFAGCRNLTSVKLPNDISEIAENTFYDCDDLESIDIPQSVTNIKDGAFSYCKSLSQITLPNNLQSLGKKAFCSSGVVSVEIPDGITELPTEVFANCTKLTEIKFSKNLKVISKNAFADCISLSKIYLPEKLERIEENAFYRCTFLSHIYIPESVTYIHENAFHNSHLSAIECPENSYAEEFVASKTKETTKTKIANTLFMIWVFCGVYILPYLPIVAIIVAFLIGEIIIRRKKHKQ